MLLLNENKNKQIAPPFFSSVPAIDYQLMPVWQLLWADLETWERLFYFSFFFYPWASFNSHSQLPACLYSFHLTVPFGQHSVPKWPYIGLGIHSGALFSRWLTLKNLRRNPQMFPLCLRKGRHCWDPGSPAWLYVCHAGIKSSGRSRTLTGGEIPQEQDGPDLPELSLLSVCQTRGT